MHETLKWIKQRAEKKKKDKNFLKNFRLQESALMIKEKLEKQSNAEKSTKEIEQRFIDAEKRISLNKKEDRLTIDEILEFYSLHQQATGAQISTEAPGDYIEMIYWLAWKVNSDKSKHDAQIQYIAKAQSKIYSNSYQVSKVIEHLSTFTSYKTVRIERRRKKVPIKKAFYPFEAFK